MKEVSHGTAGLLRIYSHVATSADLGVVYHWTTDIWIGAVASLTAYSGVSTVAGRHSL